jgi:ABC-type hemin transport system substrate-binding protein
VVATPDVAQAVTLLTSMPGARVLEARPDSVLANLDGIEPDKVNRNLVAQGVRVVAFTPERHSLEDVFIDLTSTQAKDVPS